jgi:5'-nucleotidase
MRDVFTRAWFRNWALPGVLAAVAVGVVLGAPLATPNRASANVVIAGATSLSDKVSVTYAVKPPKPEKPAKPEKEATAEETAATVEAATSQQAATPQQAAAAAQAAIAEKAGAAAEKVGAVQAAGAAAQTGTAAQAEPAVQVVASGKPPKPAKPEKEKAATGTTDVHLLAFNDLHGNLEAAGNNIYGHFAGGAAYLSKLVKDKQAEYGKTKQATIFAGDNIGASPLANGLFFEEPVTIASNLMHVDLASVGNHEFDKGSKELLRIQNGGCKPVDGCTAAPYALANGGSTNVFPGADFEYLSANVVVDATGKTLFPAFATKTFTSDIGTPLRVGFIGEVLESTPTIVTPTGVAGLTFEDEADAANAVINNKANKPIGTWVLVIHQGGGQTSGGALNGCAGNLAGSPIVDIASRLDPAIKVIVSAHTHNEYRCTITTGGVTRLITSAASFGRILSDITLTLNDKSGELVAASAENLIVDNALNPRLSSTTVRIPDPSKEDPVVAKVVDQYVTASAPLANQVIGHIQGDLTRTGTPNLGESTLGDVIADSQLAATAPANLGGAQIAFMNPGGIRADLAAGEITYGEAFTVQPFGNSLVTKTMTGDMIRRLLLQQFVGCGGTPPTPPVTILQVSHTFKYEQDRAAAACADKIGKMWVNGVEVTPTMTFRVTMNSFLAAGGDGFTVFNEGTDALGGDVDIDALVAYFADAEPGGIAVPPLNRIVQKP